MQVQTWSFVSRAPWIDVTNVFFGNNDILRPPGSLSQSRELLLFGIIGGIMFASRATCMSFSQARCGIRAAHIERSLVIMWITQPEEWGVSSQDDMGTNQRGDHK